MKRFAAIVLVVCTAILVAPRAVSAQEQGDTGITMGYPASFGFIFHVTNKIALRPEVVFARSTTEFEETFVDRDSTAWSVGVGMSALIYVAEWDQVRAYVSPRYVYTRAESNAFSALFPESESRTTSDSHLFSGSFGAQYKPHPRFSIFGEIGLGYTTSTTTSGISSLKADGTSLSTRTGAGVIFYF